MNNKEASINNVKITNDDNQLEIVDINDDTTPASSTYDDDEEKSPPNKRYQHRIEQNSSKRYIPYTNSTLETPLLHFLFGWSLKYPLAGFYFVRSIAGYPLQKRIPLTGGYTYGELLMLLPFTVFILLCYDATFINPDIEGSGHYAALPLYYAFASASRSNSVFSFLLGIPFERMLAYHKIAGYLALILGIFHTYVCYAVGDSSGDSGDRRELSSNSGDGWEFSLMGPNPDLIKYLLADGQNISGSAMLAAWAAMIVTSFVFVRRMCFDMFYLVHIALAIVTIVFGLAHGVGGLAFCLFWWALDIIVRLVVMAFSRYPHKAKIHAMSDSIVEVTFHKSSSFKYLGGQYVFLSIPKLSIFQWHPFSIASSPDDETVKIYVKVLGGWTRQLRNLCDKDQEVSMFLEGPYGIPEVDLEGNRYKHVLFIGGGIGATPMFSLCNDLLFKAKNKGKKLDKIGFVWTVRQPKDEIVTYDTETGSLIPLPSSFCPNLFSEDYTDNVTLGHNYDTNKELLHVDCYLTGAKKRRDTDKKQAYYPTLTLGRPQFDEIFENMKLSAKASGQTRVAVCACGPTKMVNTARRAAIKHSSVFGVTFDFHSETFEF